MIVVLLLTYTNCMHFKPCTEIILYLTPYGHMNLKLDTDDLKRFPGQNESLLTPPINNIVSV